MYLQRRCYFEVWFLSLIKSIQPPSCLLERDSSYIALVWFLNVLDSKNDIYMKQQSWEHTR